MLKVARFKRQRVLQNRNFLGVLGDVSSSFGMFWRFSPMADPLVEEWHSRDLDSRVGRREAEAVREFRELR